MSNLLHPIKRRSENMVDGDYIFRFYKADGTVHWEAPLWKSKCKANLQDGTPCLKMTTRIHPYCYECMTRLFHVAISPSTQGEEAGLGLFAFDPYKADGDIVFEKGDFVAPYIGEHISNAELEKRYLGSHDGPAKEKAKVNCPYAIENSNHETIDAALVRGPASYANDHKDKKYNAMLSEIPLLGIVASKRIYQHDEIFVSYGRVYWNSIHQNFETVKFDSLPKKMTVKPKKKITIIQKVVKEENINKSSPIQKKRKAQVDEVV